MWGGTAARRSLGATCGKTAAIATQERASERERQQSAGSSEVSTHWAERCQPAAQQHRPPCLPTALKNQNCFEAYFPTM
jgi:hypothetical protein